ncbi:Extracellular endo-alpha-(1-_5)-L-arabinanase 1 [Dyadobacter sp. CECT 9275]|uniref:Extracellular endo-alpha-(1->5)-L-arabinanase 1 n=1 Tax=Dyadobacter helix TaxID=2822344 RepID=A0A916J901_9BACT|nr:family 43 glycosylhydrolase [Dyadobacter sp. CECT 9275]CAG4990950.1 Extracellular endo-alpha-(1->5)-L-arabinanase 1 [Dyadobacter sp. CECT 9275]
MMNVLFSLLLILSFLGESGIIRTIAIPGAAFDPADSAKYTNPVFEPVLADPSVIRGTDGWFYAFGTMDDWGDGKGAHLVPILRSRNLTRWTFLKDAFIKKPSWKEKGGIWAPDIARVNGRYHLYYAFSTWGDTDPGIGLAVADSVTGPFQDQGKLFLSLEVNVPNSIDPFYLEDAGRKYIFWGSYSNASNQGTFGVELAGDGKSVPDLGKKFKVAAGDFEAVMIHRRNGYYYFFGSKENCCDAEKSKYQVRVGRSQKLAGPYLDQEGKPLKERGAGTLLLHRTETVAGPGHNSRIITDKNGQDWMLYHAIDVKQPKVPSGANRRVLMLDKITWKNGWPEIKNQQPGIIEQNAPTF